MVHHHLVVLYQIHFSLVFLIEVVLALTVRVTLLEHRCSAALVSSTESVLPVVILTQVVVERLLAMDWLVRNAQASIRV